MTIEQLINYTKHQSDVNSSYTSYRISKAGKVVSIFNNQSSFYSMYNPVQDAQNFASQFDSHESNFIVIGGMGNAYHIQELFLKQPESFFLVLEDSYSSYKKLLSQNDFSFFNNKNSVHFCTINDFEQHLLNLYKPSIHGNIIFKSIRSWSDYHHALAETIRSILQKALSIISADYSVQTHFGKVWMRNIFRNIQILQNKPESFTSINTICDYEKSANSVSIFKPAAIIAAGPSLDDSIQLLQKNPEHYYIIATDTAYEILIKYGIKPDVFVTIDGQNISSKLFTTVTSSKLTPSLAVIDCGAHPNAVNFAVNKEIPIVLCSTGHPLSNWFQKHHPEITSLSSGSGTVTITALDFAIRCGFTSIVFFGADFSCPKSKPYAKGSYLDTSFFSMSNRFNTFENQHISIMFRTEVSKKENCYYTPILDSYKKSLLDYTHSNNTGVSFFSAIKSSLPFPVYVQNTKNDIFTLKTQKIHSKKNSILLYINAILNDDEEIITTFLPYYAWYLHNNKLKPSKSAFFSFKTLVKKQIANYTDIHYES